MKQKLLENLTSDTLSQYTGINQDIIKNILKKIGFSDYLEIYTAYKDKNREELIQLLNNMSSIKEDIQPIQPIQPTQPNSQNNLNEPNIEKDSIVKINNPSGNEEYASVDSVDTTGKTVNLRTDDGMKRVDKDLLSAPEQKEIDWLKSLAGLGETTTAGGIASVPMSNNKLIKR